MGCILGDGLMINFGDVMFLNHYFFQVLDRGEKIELLVDKTENLRSQVGKIEFMPDDTVTGVCGYILQKQVSLCKCGSRCYWVPLGSNFCWHSDECRQTEGFIIWRVVVLSFSARPIIGNSLGAKINCCFLLKSDPMFAYSNDDVMQAQDFKQQGTKIRRKMWLQNMKIKLIVLGIIIALILIIILSVCHGFKC